MQDKDNQGSDQEEQESSGPEELLERWLSQCLNNKVCVPRIPKVRVLIGCTPFIYNLLVQHEQTAALLNPCPGSQKLFTALGEFAVKLSACGKPQNLKFISSTIIYLQKHGERCESHLFL